MKMYLVTYAVQIAHYESIVPKFQELPHVTLIHGTEYMDWPLTRDNIDLFRKKMSISWTEIVKRPIPTVDVAILYIKELDA